MPQTVPITSHELFSSFEENIEWVCMDCGKAGATPGGLNYLGKIPKDHQYTADENGKCDICEAEGVTTIPVTDFSFSVV